jgi:hypothetical protein
MILDSFFFQVDVLEAGTLRASHGSPHGVMARHLEVAKVPLNMHVLGHVASCLGNVLLQSIRTPISSHDHDNAALIHQSHKAGRSSQLV